MKLSKSSKSAILSTIFFLFFVVCISIGITSFVCGITSFAIKTKEELIIQQNKTNEILLRIEERLEK